MTQQNRRTIIFSSLHGTFADLWRAHHSEPETRGLPFCDFGLLIPAMIHLASGISLQGVQPTLLSRVKDRLPRTTLEKSTP